MQKYEKEAKLLKKTSVKKGKVKDVFWKMGQNKCR